MWGLGTADISDSAAVAQVLLLDVRENDRRRPFGSQAEERGSPSRSGGSALLPAAMAEESCLRAPNLARLWSGSSKRIKATLFAVLAVHFALSAAPWRNDGTRRLPSFAGASEQSKGDGFDWRRRRSEPTPHPGEDYASRAAKANLELARPCLERLRSAHPPEPLPNRTGPGLNCLALFSVGPGGSEIVQQTRGCEVEVRRPCAVLAWLRYAVKSTPPKLKVSRPFRFWLSFADSAILSSALHATLGLPTLVPGKPRTDECGIAVPEFYSMFALIAGDKKLHATMQDLCPNATDICHTMKFFTALFRSFPKLAKVPWDRKQPRAVLRARCYPTYTLANDSGQINPFFTRGQICQEAAATEANRDLLDIGLIPASETAKDPNDPNAGCSESGRLSELCKMCLPCNAGSHLDRTQQATRFRFQVAVDGYGLTWDAVYWKLASNSTVFSVKHDGGVPYTQWFENLLEEGKNHIAVTVGELRGAVETCRSNPDRCRRIAMVASRTFGAAFSLEQIEQYWVLLLQNLHDNYAF